MMLREEYLLGYSNLLFQCRGLTFSTIPYSQFFLSFKNSEYVKINHSHLKTKKVFHYLFENVAFIVFIDLKYLKGAVKFAMGILLEILFQKLEHLFPRF